MGDSRTPNVEGDMRRFTFGIACLMIVSGCVAGCGEKPHDVIVKYKAEIHVPGGKPEEKKFDMANKAERDALMDALEHGHVGELAVDEKIDLFSLKRWDLGLWSIGIFIILFLLLAKYAWKPMLDGLTKRE